MKKLFSVLDTLILIGLLALAICDVARAVH
jgi:hypothetical protein